MPAERIVRSLADVRSVDLPIAGGKAVGLGELIAAGVDVPEGFVITTHAYREAVAGLGAELTAAQVAETEIPDAVASAIIEAYAALGGATDSDMVVAVRSSATAEDLPGASFAGQHDTVLGVAGPQAVLEAVRRCWASLWGERAVAYRERLATDPGGVAIAVVVQRLVDADFAGVMLTADPVTGDRDVVVIDSNPGLGEAVVAGLVTPDHAVLDELGRVRHRRPGNTEVVITARPGGGTTTTERDESTPAADSQALDDPTLARLAVLGRQIAERSGRPMDIEWAISDGTISILQARPMTALPPPPRQLNRFQRQIGPVLYELVPRRPTPMELTAWARRVVTPLVEQLLDALAGMHLDFDDILVDRDSIVTEYVPPSPRPTRRTPPRLVHTLGSARRDPSRWADDPRRTRYIEVCRELASLDLVTLPWSRLVGIPDEAAAAVSLLTGLRADFLPPTPVAMIRLRAVLAAVGLPGHVGALVSHADTLTSAANKELVAIAELARGIPAVMAAAETAADSSGEQLLTMLRTVPAAAPVWSRLQDFLATYGHRETSTLLMLREPTWAESPSTVGALLQVLLTQSDSPDEVVDPLPHVLSHPGIRRMRLSGLVERLVTTARAGIAMREDSHFELTRLLPVVRRTVEEAGRRIAAAGWLADPEDVWFLTWPEVMALPDPAGSGPGDPIDLRGSAQRRRAAYDELVAAPLIATTTLYPASTPSRHEVLVSGIGGGGGQVTGTVRLVAGPADFGHLRAGEILVCRTTSPAWTPLFYRAAAVVVDHGGLASHAGIVARECGIPSVMGTGSATSVLVTGQRVLVDGDRGEVLLASD